MPSIEFRGVSKVYDDGDGLQPTDLFIGADEFVAVVGPSGSGKSTIIRLIAGLERPDHGDILFDGSVVNDIPTHARGIGMVVSTGALYSKLTAEANIGFPLQIANVKAADRKERVRKTASRFNVRSILGRKPQQISVGERQLVATGRATIRDTSIVLFDEALSGIDPHRRQAVKNELRSLHRERHTVLFATNSQDEAMAMSTLLIILNDGRVQQIAAPLDAYRRPANAFVASFLGDPGMNLLPGAIVAPGRLALGDDELDMPASGRVGPVLVGIRPEHVRLAEPSTPFTRCLHARAMHVERLGADSIIHVAFGSADSGSLDFAVRSRHPRVPQVGENVELAVDVDHVTLFEATTGDRIGADIR
ncbi:MAG: ABC transporter ATP-binding protein [Acidimicrobiia bacterium]|nr:ABC transporter ATP-binding protein [Acidimicrobiia bacterium]